MDVRYRIYKSWAMLDAVEDVTGKKISGRHSEEVKKFFGRAI